MWAIENALTLSLAGAIESVVPDRHDYELALSWVQDEMESRSKPTVDDRPVI